MNQRTRPMKVALSWSAGKDSCLVWLRLREQGVDVPTFLTMCDADGRSTSHALPEALVQAQVQAMGGTSIRVAVQPGRYAESFSRALQALAASGHTHLACGDIDLQAHRDWIEPRCRGAGLTALFPLWGQSRAALAQEVLQCGIRARVVALDLERLDERFIGRPYDAALLQQLPPNVCPCGEDGEFHTFVENAPGFAAPLSLHAGRVRRVPNAPPLRAGWHLLQTPALA